LFRETLLGDRGVGTGRQGGVQLLPLMVKILFFASPPTHNQVPTPLGEIYYFFTIYSNHITNSYFTILLINYIFNITRLFTENILNCNCMKAFFQMSSGKLAQKKEVSNKPAMI